MASHLYSKERYHASVMIITIHIDVLYISKYKVCNQAGGYFYLVKKTLKNNAILTLSKTLKKEMLSESER